MKWLVQLCIALLVVVASHSQSIQSEHPDVQLAPALPDPARPNDPAEGALIIAEAVVEGLASEKFTLGYEYMPDWMKNSGERQTAVKIWRMKEGWERWRDLKPRFEGENGLDPKDKSGITNSENSWLAAKSPDRWAVLMGLYRVYAVDEWERRLKEGDWYLSGRNVQLDVEGQGKAQFKFANKYNDMITAEFSREGGAWYLAGLSLKMDVRLPSKPKD